PEARLAPVAWLNEKLSPQLKQIPLTQPHTSDVLPYCWADWETACHLEHVAQQAPHAVQAAAAEGRVAQAKLLESVMLSPTSLYVSLFFPRNHADQERLAAILSRAIAAFEPRLQQIRVTVESITENERALWVRIDAGLVVESVTEPVSFQVLI